MTRVSSRKRIQTRTWFTLSLSLSVSLLADSKSEGRATEREKQADQAEKKGRRQETTELEKEMLQPHLLWSPLLLHLFLQYSSSYFSSFLILMKRVTEPTVLLHRFQSPLSLIASYTATLYTCIFLYTERS